MTGFNQELLSDNQVVYVPTDARQKTKAKSGRNKKQRGLLTFRRQEGWWQSNRPVLTQGQRGAGPERDR